MQEVSAAHDDKTQAHGEIGALAENSAADHLADDDGGKADDDAPRPMLISAKP